MMGGLKRFNFFVERRTLLLRQNKLRKSGGERASRVLLRQLEALGDLLRSLFSLISPQLAFELKGAPPASFIWSSKAFPDWLEGHLKRKRQFFLLRWSSGDRERSRSARSLFA